MNYVNIFLAVGILLAGGLIVKRLMGMVSEGIAGEQAAAFAYTDISGETDDLFETDSYDHITLLVFQASCSHCRDIIPTWNALASGHDGEYVGLSISPQEETLIFMSDNNTHFPVILVGTSFLAGYHLSGTPSSVTIKRGIIDRIVVGSPNNEDLSYLNELR